MKNRTIEGVKYAVAANEVARILESYRISVDQDFSLGEPELTYTSKQILELWLNRGRLGIRPGYNRFVQAKIVGW